MNKLTRISKAKMTAINNDQPPEAKYGDVFEAIAQAQLDADNLKVKEILAQVKTKLESNSCVRDGMASATTQDKFRTLHYRESDWQSFFKKLGI